jgi:hypothetical protein
MAMEEEFGVEISDEDAQTIQKVQDAISFVERKRASNAFKRPVGMGRRASGPPRPRTDVP